MKLHARILGAAALALAGGVFAAGGGGGGSSGGPTAIEDPLITSVKVAIAKKDWLGAQSQLKKALADSPNNADYHNLLAYTTRKGPNPDMDLVFKEYNEALRINPKHKGAHEYIGEAYLQVGDLAKAKEHLAALNKICFFGCEEYSDLKKEVAEFEARK